MSYVAVVRGVGWCDQQDFKINEKRKLLEGDPWREIVGRVKIIDESIYVDVCGGRGWLVL